MMMSVKIVMPMNLITSENSDDFDYDYDYKYADHDQSLSPGVDCQGALEAARRFTDHQVLHTGYR